MSGNQPPGYGYPQGGSGQDPYGQQNPYGQQPQQNPYGQQPPQQNPYESGGYAAPGTPPAAGGNPYDQGQYAQGQYTQAPYGAPGGAPAGMPPLAESGQRFLARLIDTGVLIAFFVVATALFVDFDDATAMSFSGNIMASLMGYGLYFVYEGVMLSRDGQTLGKKAMKIRVAMLADGRVPGSAGWIRAAVYALPGVISCLGVIFWLLNSLWHLWDKPYQQCLHDKAAKTVVVKTS
ncbi:MULTISPECIES: RDD family protein [Streptomyces]|uniref:RDD family protein n=1 Tax=Streptomyces TaxID=1883 RepID=UPI0022AA2661|nr:RDD family protein [Streptomyces sp. HB2AG]MCZ2523383.1 RDD family protein [Streptomyces sp. HB2AG]